MKVYIVTAHWNYDASDIVGVFYTEKAAKECRNRLTMQLKVFDVDRYDVSEHEVEE